MLSALDDEIAAAGKSADEGIGYRLKEGVRVAGETGTGVRYRFSFVGRLKEIPAGDAWRLALQERSVAGDVVDLSRERVVFDAQEDLGERVFNARLAVDNTQILRDLKKRLQSLLDDEGSRAAFNWDLARQVLHHADVRQVGGEVTQLPPGWGGLNAEQQSAVRSAVRSSLTLLWGPPGTGKTTTLGQIIATLYGMGLRVLLISNTNAAVDAALVKVADALKDEKGLRVGSVQRLGSRSTPALKVAFLDGQVEDYVLPAKILERLVGPDLEKATKIQGRIVALEQERASLTAALAQVEAVAALRASLRELGETLASARAESARAGEELRKVESQVLEAKDRLARLLGERGLVAFCHRRRLRKAGANLGAAEAVREKCEIRVRDGERREEQTQRALETAQADLAARLSSTGASAMEPEEARKRLDIVVKDLPRAQGDLKAVRARIEELGRLVRKERRVTAATLATAFLKEPDGLEADVVIVDEVSMSTLPTVVYASGLARRSVVCIGDFRQLPAVVKGKTPDCREWLARDVFELHDVPGRVGRGNLPGYVVSLREQHRMDGRICAVANALFYPEAPLVTRTRQQDPVSQAFGGHPLRYIDTSLLSPVVTIDHRARVNYVHAGILVELARRFIESGDTRIGVTVPFKKQMRLVQEMLEGTVFWGDSDGMINTVHGFQGSERPIILVDFTDAHGVSPSGFLSEGQLTDTGPRLLNVAVTRAQSQVVLVADLGYFLGPESPVPVNSLAKQVAAYFQKHGEAIDVRDWTGTSHGAQATEPFMHVYGETNFLESLAADVAKAQESVEIWAPSLTERGVEGAMSWLKMIGERGVHASIYTRPAAQQAGYARRDEVGHWLARLEEMGAHVVLRKDVREQMAVIDGETTWFGSLSILDQLGAADRMVRVSSKPLAASVMQAIGSRL